MDLDAMSKLIGNFGFPIALITVMLFVAWRVLVWLGPRVDKVIDGHVAFLTQMHQHMKTQEDATGRMETALEKVATGFGAMADSWERLKDRVAAAR